MTYVTFHLFYSLLQHNCLYPSIAMLLSLFSPANASPCSSLPPYSSTELIVKCSRDYQIGDEDEQCRFENGAENRRGGKEL